MCCLLMHTLFSSLHCFISVLSAFMVRSRCPSYAFARRIIVICFSRIFDRSISAKVESIAFPIGVLKSNPLRRLMMVIPYCRIKRTVFSTSIVSRLKRSMAYVTSTSPLRTYSDNADKPFCCNAGNTPEGGSHPHYPLLHGQLAALCA